MSKKRPNFIWDSSTPMVKQWPNSCKQVTDYIDELEMSHAALETDAAMMEQERDFYRRQYHKMRDTVEKLEKEIDRKDRVFNDLCASRGVE